MTIESDQMDRLEEAIYSKVLEVIRLLRESNRRIVLAESCTGGLAAAWFTSIPGVSDVFCGSAVVYRTDTKAQWLGLDPTMLADEKIGPVSPQASEQLAQKVLLMTPEADVSLGITGHLGPNAPTSLNRKVFLAGLLRDPRSQDTQRTGQSRNSSAQKPWHSARECNLELSGFFIGDLSENRRFLQSLALWETLCFGVEALKTTKIVEFPTKNNSLEKNGKN